MCSVLCIRTRPESTYAMPKHEFSDCLSGIAQDEPTTTVVSNPLTPFLLVTLYQVTGKTLCQPSPKAPRCTPGGAFHSPWPPQVSNVVTVPQHQRASEKSPMYGLMPWRNRHGRTIATMNPIVCPYTCR